MKKLLFMVCILITVNISAQPFGAFQGTNKGFGMQIGFQIEEGLQLGTLFIPDGIQIVTGFHVSITNALNADIFYGSTGYNILLTHNDENNFILTPTLGVAKSYVQIETDKYDVINIKETKLIYGLEFGKDLHIGRLFLSANKCGKWFYGLGIKAFIK